MKTIFRICLMLIVGLQSQAKYSSGDRARDTQYATDQANKISSTSQAGNGTVKTGYDTLEQSSKDTMKNSQKGQTTAKIMQMGMYAMGGMYAAACPPTNYGACVKAAILFMMGSQAGKSASSFNAPIATSWDNACTYSTLGCNGQTPNNPYDAALTPGLINTGKNGAADIQVALSKGGYEVDINSGKIKTPKGELNANDPASLASALGSDGMSSLMSQVKDVEKDAKFKVDQVKTGAVTAALGFDGGGGGGAIGTVTDGYGDGSSGGGINGVGSKLDKFRKPAQAKGLSKNYNGDPIGVASDSIFEMMSRRYQLKTTQKTFFGAEVQ